MDVGVPALLILAAALLQGGVADSKDAERALKQFKAYPRDKHPEEEYIEAMNAMARTVHERTLKRLADIVIESSESPRVRVAAALAMATMTPLHKQVASQLSAAYGSASRVPQVQLIVLQVLGMTKEPGALAVLHRALEEKDGEVVRRALASTVLVRSSRSVDPILTLLAKLEKRIPEAPADADGLKETADVCVRSLEALTGQSFSSAAQGQAWWNRNRDTFKAPQ